jgi:hypothetical protein
VAQEIDARTGPPAMRTIGETVWGFGGVVSIRFPDKSVSILAEGAAQGNLKNFSLCLASAFLGRISGATALFS